MTTGISLGGTPVTGVYLGSTPITGVYLGASKLWPAAAATAYWWDPTVKNASITLSGTNNNTATGTASGWASLRGVTGNSSGKRYLEIPNLVGGKMVMAGLSDATPNLAGYGGSDAHGWTSYGSTGNVYHSGVNKPCLPVWGGGVHVVQVCHDPATGSIWFGVDDTWVGDPVAGTGASYTGAMGTLYPCGSFNGAGGSLGVRVKASEFTCTPPAGSSSWSGA